ncbi:glycosyltransferase family 32 protein [Sphingobacterium bambusae]|uniref:Glycosyltransferase family 32 protein n=1 Tax=Sphingobacterium bambusae TaxID=662858 RepID=A0ABW6BGJ5_9SPHI|nr:glycosyltransferase [Sphingobacterium bambusae]WPL47461.1 glycosyltransferase [Sphingobacterium bambusae]
MQKIPKIIHQIWSGVDGPLPKEFKTLGETWKRDYPDWEYCYWDNKKMIEFVKSEYPEHWYVYQKYPFNVQRWDAIRYLILEKIGGMYVDFDYESMRSMEEILDNKTCCFSLEKDAGGLFRVFNNAMMMSTPNHPFMHKIVKFVFSRTTLIPQYTSKNLTIFNTTGPYALIRLYETLTPTEKQDVYLIPAHFVSPFTGLEAEEIRLGVENQELEDCLDDAYAVHYYVSNWAKTNN